MIEKIDFKDTAVDTVFRDLEKAVSKSLGKKFKFRFEKFSPADKDLPPLTFRVNDIPAIDAVAAICNGLKLKYRVEKNGIVISK